MYKFSKTNMPNAAPSTREKSSFAVHDRRLGRDKSDGDTAEIAAQLARRKNLDLVIQRFDNGEADVRDAVGFTVQDRAVVLDFGKRIVSGQTHTVPVQDRQNIYRVMSGVTNNFAAMMHDYEGGTHPQAGYNFAAYATVFRDQGYAWAVNLDESLAAVSNDTGSGLDALLALGPEAEYKIRHKLGNYAESNKVDLAWYLAEQSQKSEDIQREMYAPELVKSKLNARRLIGKMAEEYGLPSEHFQRAMLQLDRTEFSAFDPMNGGITYEDRKSLGDYVDGTFRVEVKLGGSPHDPRLPVDALDTLQHELFHSTSAQDIEGRTGLATAKYHGLRPNEGMTELLTQLALDKIRYENGKTKFHVRMAYKPEVRAAHWMMIHDAQRFGTLFNAYYGNTPSEKELKSALDKYYSVLDDFESQSLN